ncbi:NAD-dependent deacetylase [Pandoraea thiooxydans]|uniref:protein acetyllysine N-acetyltransferase n=1 Tax=Pandoraea thiooxydans TaxID=445709 RepID=A0A0G3ENT4_9BURK|nr:NAD-dependent protein deacetylase [Pandoraea thiooxydans]AKJ67669.1 hypothetical protein ABW99_04945 [Pandoraea thiooxydans]APR94787.1 NAD-dependent deacetylase [Pandoraea thiooxydans]
MAPSEPTPTHDARAADALHGFVARHPRLLVLSGAGLSTASGIPGYRDETGAWRGRQPIQLKEFLGSTLARQRYWARSLHGWPVVAQAAPNPAHYALARLAEAGHVRQLVTQNVDGLHQRAGSGDVIELHGNIGQVICLACRTNHARADIQAVLVAENPHFAERAAARSAEPAPDGDADLEVENFETFRIPTCRNCGGMLKPDVVFFGENVPLERVDAARRALEQADALLVVGSSLMVFSGYRFCVLASQWGKPIAAVNLGHTRADPLLSLKVRQPCSEALTGLLERLGLGQKAGAVLDA